MDLLWSWCMRKPSLDCILMSCLMVLVVDNNLLLVFLLEMTPIVIGYNLSFSLFFYMFYLHLVFWVCNFVLHLELGEMTCIFVVGIYMEKVVTFLKHFCQFVVWFSKLGRTCIDWWEECGINYASIRVLVLRFVVVEELDLKIGILVVRYLMKPSLELRDCFNMWEICFMLRIQVQQICVVKCGYVE